MIKGIQYIVDDKGNKKSVILDLDKWGEYWEDFYDILVSESRRDEPNISWDKLKKEALSS
jgi:hypothetical protein